MANKNLNVRISLKHDVEENWVKATNFIPQAGEVIIYDPDANYSYVRIKIGNGITLVNELPFYGEDKQKKIFLQDTEPVAEIGSIWIDTSSSGILSAENVEF